MTQRLLTAGFILAIWLFMTGLFVARGMGHLEYRIAAWSLPFFLGLAVFTALRRRPVA